MLSAIIFIIILFLLGWWGYTKIPKVEPKTEQEIKREKEYEKELFRFKVLEQEKQRITDKEKEENLFTNVIKLSTLIDWRLNDCWLESLTKIPNKKAVYCVFVRKIDENQIVFGDIKTLNGKEFCPNKNISLPDTNSLQRNFKNQLRFDKDYIALYIGCTGELNERLKQLAGMSLGENLHTGGKDVWSIQNYQDYLYVSWKFISPEKDAFDEKEKAITIYKQEHDGGVPIANVL